MTPTASQATPSYVNRLRRRRESLQKKQTILAEQMEEVKLTTADGGKAQHILKKHIT